MSVAVNEYRTCRVAAPSAAGATWSTRIVYVPPRTRTREAPNSSEERAPPRRDVGGDRVRAEREVRREAPSGGVGGSKVRALELHDGGDRLSGQPNGAVDEGADRQLQAQRDGGGADGELYPQNVLPLEAPVSRPGQVPIHLHGIPPRREGCRVSARAVQHRRGREGTRDESSEDDGEGRGLKGAPVESKDAGYRDLPRSG